MSKEIDNLASWLIGNVPDEPSQNEGAVDTAIRVMATMIAERDQLRARVAELQSRIGDTESLRLAQSIVREWLDENGGTTEVSDEDRAELRRIYQERIAQSNATVRGRLERGEKDGAV